MAKIETGSIFASLVSGTTLQSENFSFTGSLILSNDLLADAVQTHNLGAPSGSFNDVYARAISNPDSSSTLQINSSNGGDIAFTFNGSSTALTLDATNQYLTYNSAVGGGLGIKGTSTAGAVTVAGGSDVTESTGGRISCFGQTSADPGAVRIYAQSGQPIRFYSGSTEVWRCEGGHFFPVANNSRDIGTTSQNVRYTYTNVVANSMAGNHLDIQSLNGGGIQFNIDGNNEMFMSETAFYPNTNGGMSLGATNNRFGTVFSSVFANDQSGADVTLRASDDIVFRTNGVNRWVIFDPGVLRPNIASTYDVGTSSTRCNVVYSDSFLPFTGLHLYKIKDGESLSAGDAVCIHNEEIKKCDESLSPTCIGIVSTISSGIELDTTEEGFVEDSFKNQYTVSGTDYMFASVAQCGDNYTVDLPGFKVCDENGPINAGDLLCTASGHPGYLKKWTPDVNTINCIVGKTYQDVTFVGGLAEEVYGTLKA